ncbi:helix-turn-helix domain-containing protein [Litchfieldia salsa]|uniref:helix-turn-helix domain-containing protein n=1 Tax=Litchfieldia salsa TaxID=930152 RepID=UPI0015879138|nr:helix-turn-helix domain-containing protein [Litchfieldia salsa]
MAKKYSYYLKLTVVREYQEGKLGIRPLAKKHGIRSKSVVERWIKVYERFGAEGLKSKNKTYTVQFRLDVLKCTSNLKKLPLRINRFIIESVYLKGSISLGARHPNKYPLT